MVPRNQCLSHLYGHASGSSHYKPFISDGQSKIEDYNYQHTFNLAVSFSSVSCGFSKNQSSGKYCWHSSEY